MNNISDEFRETFFEETDEHLMIFNDNLIALEKGKNKKIHINVIFRILHTLKSSAAAVGLNELGQFTHKAEDLVQYIRNGNIKLDTVIMDLLFEIGDHLQHYILKAKKMKESDIDLQPITNKIIKINSEWAIYKENTGKKTGVVKQQKDFKLNKKDKTLISKAKKAGKKCYSLAFEIDPQEKIKGLRAQLIINLLEKISQIVVSFPDKKTILSDIFDGRFTVVLMTKKKAREIEKSVDVDLIKTFQIKEVVDPDKSIPLVKKKDAEESWEKSEDESNVNAAVMNSLNISHTIRIPVKRLDTLLHLIGELIIINSGLKIQEERLRELKGTGEVYNEINFLTDNLIKVSSDLQNGVMKARMVPIKMMFNQFKRIVRDLSIKEKKEVDLVIYGGDTELDKNVIDTIGDPLMHMVRNAVDHGIETAEEREKAGKPSHGIITLSASQSGNHIIITLQDDGRGIDIEKIKDFAVRKGLTDEKQIEEMEQNEIIQYIFEPGFTTTKKVSAVSGRGIGLDVVKTGITSLNGSIQVNTDFGQGTEFRIILPLTLAITTVVVVESNTTLYAFPILDIEETIKIQPHQIKDKECVKVIKHRDQVLPIVNLREIFPNDQAVSEEIENEHIPVLIIRAMDKKVGIVVDRILNKQDVMLKALETHYRSVKGISGAAVLGDGKVVLVIDTLQVLQNFLDKKQISNQEVSATVR